MTGRKIKASTHFSERRWLRNQQEAARLREEGYTVERGGHPNGAYLAFIGNHQEHEKTVGRIFAENGFSFTLDREGCCKTHIGGKTYTLPSPDGHIAGFSHEIYGFEGIPTPQKVVDAIKHSRKVFKANKSMFIQSDIAISIARRGSGYTTQHITIGVEEYKRQFLNHEAQAKPLLYLHVDEEEKSISYWRIRR